VRGRRHRQHRPLGPVDRSPGTASTDLWVLSIDRQEWQPLGSTGQKPFTRKGQLFDIYGQCVYDPHHKVFVAMSKGYGSRTKTLLLRPDFGKIKWGTK
jgi:hypothetical protein